MQRQYNDISIDLWFGYIQNIDLSMLYQHMLPIPMRWEQHTFITKFCSSKHSRPIPQNRKRLYHHFNLHHRDYIVITFKSNTSSIWKRCFLLCIVQISFLSLISFLLFMTLFCTDATVADRWLIFPVAVRVRPGWLVAADAPVFNCEHRWFRKYKYQYNTIQYNILQKALVSRSGCSSFLMWP